MRDLSLYAPPPEAGPLPAAVRARAFWLLVRSGRPLPFAELGAPDGWTTADVRQVVDEMADAGRMTVADGAVTGSLGLTVTPTRHLLALPDGDRYTWCALDALGVFGALGVSGQIRSSTPDGDPVVIDVDAGSPRDIGDLAMLLPDRRPGPVVRNWCPLVNFFPDVERASAWATEKSLNAISVSVAEALEIGTQIWSAALAHTNRLGEWSVDR